MAISKIPGAGISGGSVTVNQSAPDNSLVVDSSGNVGIGTSSPTQKLTVAGSVQLNDGNLILNDAGDAIVSAQGTANTDFYINSNRSIRFTFGGTPSGGTERMRIDSSGNLSLGTTGTFLSSSYNFVSSQNSGFFRTTASANNNTAVLASRNGNAGNVVEFWYDNSISPGRISITSTTTTYATSSDYRLKENVAPMTGALDTVSQLKPVTYTWKADGSEGQGFIAHELAEVVSQAVTGEKDAVELVDIKDEEGNVIGQEERPVYQGIDTSFLVATLTAAIQELKAELDTVKTELATLKGGA